jgi:hypothetical protein
MGMRKDYSTPEEMQEVIDAYFKKCEENKVPKTVQGLTLALGWNSRQTLLNYENEEKRPEFVDTVKKAKLEIEKDKVEGAMTGKYNTAFTIFDLKNNHDHKDKTEVDNNHTGAMPVILQETKTYLNK